MDTNSEPESEAARLEQLWGGEFGNEYVDRNRSSYEQRQPFWDNVIERTQCRSVLEVGCNVGGNLQYFNQRLAPGTVHGVDINRKALSVVHHELPDTNAVWSPARDIPFRDRRFDLVFTMGVLIHQPEDTLPLVMNEMVRCSSRWVLCGEYFGEATEEVAYRGHEGALFRRDYGRRFQELFGDLALRDQGFLGKDEGWDDITWWLFERGR